MHNRIYSATLGDLTEAAMRLHLVDEAINLAAAKRMVMWISGSFLMSSAALLIWGLTR